MWLIILSDQLSIVALVSGYLTNKLMDRMAILNRRSFHLKEMPLSDDMGYYPRFLKAIPQLRVGSIRVTHPFAGRRHPRRDPLPLDSHVLSLPLAFILSQDQTLRSI